MPIDRSSGWKAAPPAITPGYLFSATDQYRNFIRLNAANWSEGAERAIRRLGEMIGALA